MNICGLEYNKLQIIPNSIFSDSVFYDLKTSQNHHDEHQLLFYMIMLVRKGGIMNKVYAAKSLQSCPTLCDPRDDSPPGSPVSGILQARTLEWVAISFSNAWKWKVKVKSLSDVRLLATPWTAADQAPPSMGFSRQEHWSGVPLPSPSYSISIQKYIKFLHILVNFLCTSYDQPFNSNYTLMW